MRLVPRILLLSVLVTIIFLIVGIRYFINQERTAEEVEDGKGLLYPVLQRKVYHHVFFARDEFLKLKTCHRRFKFSLFSDAVIHILQALPEDSQASEGLSNHQNPPPLTLNIAIILVVSLLTVALLISGICCQYFKPFSVSFAYSLSLGVRTGRTTSDSKLTAFCAFVCWVLLFSFHLRVFNDN